MNSLNEIVPDEKSDVPESNPVDSLLVGPDKAPDATPEKSPSPSLENPVPASADKESSSKSASPFSFLPGQDSPKSDHVIELPPIVLRTTNKPKATPPPLPKKAAPKKGPPPLPVKAKASSKTTPISIPEPKTEPIPPLEPAPVTAITASAATSTTTPAAATSTPPEKNAEPGFAPKVIPTASEPASKPAEPETTTAPADGSATSSYLIQTRGLVKQYGGRRVVNGVDIHVRNGEVVGLLGKNGAGKTTTFYMIVGLVPPTEGHVFMGNEDVTRMPMYRRARRGIGYLPQEESIFRKLTVEENLLAILETLPMTEDERDARCDELLRDFGLEHVRENVAITLSGGEKRRVTIARALVTSPTLLLLDEPFSGVDPMAVHDIQEIILQLKQRGLGVLITDHNVRETLSVVDRAYIIDEGRVLSEGSREFLLNDPIAREIYLGHRFSM
ncbi:MAG: LPS export ABC transporter ATP-binding protein [Methylacidiphilales bacterium]|nr:LPS export ABC transporter ATP-binding protein [Candidatus Methylacidiphilales bacterium]